MEENKEVRKAKNIDGKRYVYIRIYLSKPAAEGAAAAHRDRGHLARVITRMVWTKIRGVPYGYDSVKGYVLYVHHTTEEERELKRLHAMTTWRKPLHKHEEEFNKKLKCPCGSGKTPFTFEEKQYCNDCAPLYIGD
jgi:hypothetical protein